MKTKLFTLLLCAVLCFCALPMSAFAADADVTVTYTLTNMTATGETTVTAGNDLYVHLMATEGYMMPESITVTIGGTEVTEGYRYDMGITKLEGSVLILAADITGDIVISVDAVKKWDVIFIGETWTTAVPVPAGESLNENYGNPDLTPEKDGYVFSGWFESTDSGETLDDTPFDFDTKLTADVTVYPLWTPVTDETTTTTAPTAATTTTTAPSTQSPQTGDSAATVSIALLMLSAAVVVLTAAHRRHA